MLLPCYPTRFTQASQATPVLCPRPLHLSLPRPTVHASPSPHSFSTTLLSVPYPLVPTLLSCSDIRSCPPRARPPLLTVYAMVAMPAARCARALSPLPVLACRSVCLQRIRSPEVRVALRSRVVTADSGPIAGVCLLLYISHQCFARGWPCIFCYSVSFVRNDCKCTVLHSYTALTALR